MQRLFDSEISNLVFHFRDYILHKYQVELEIKEEQTRSGILFSVYIDSTNSHLTKIQQECDKFLNNPIELHYKQASWEIGKTNHENILFFTKIWNNRSLLILWKKQKFTVFLTILCICLYILQIIGLENRILLFSHYPDKFEQGELWRYFSHSWVHLSHWHIVFNLVWWWIFAGKIEQNLGTIQLIMIYVLSVLVSGFAQNIVSGPTFFGLSGAVYSVLGYVLILDKFSYIQRFNLPSGFFTMLIMGIGFGFIAPLFGISIGNTAHITGLFTGILLAFFKIFFTK